MSESLQSNKEAYVKDLFSRIAKSYDLINDLMTGFLHKAWKADMIKHASVNIKKAKEADAYILDLCTGTGDIAFLWSKEKNVQRVEAIDSCEPMLKVAREKQVKQDSKASINFTNADALELPFPDASFDAITVGFGLRNVTDLTKAIAEIKRVLKPGGFIVSLDLGHPVVPIIDRLYRNLFLKSIPVLGKNFAKDKAAYQYLVDSLETWPKQAEFSQMFWDQGFQRSYFKNIMFGAIAMVVAQK